MKKLFLLLIPITLLFLGGCSKLWKTVICTSDLGTWTQTVIWETNIRVLIKESDWDIKVWMKSDWNMRKNCHRIWTEKQPPNMLSWYENMANYLQ